MTVMLRMIGDEDKEIATKVRLAMLRTRFMTLAEVEAFCSGTATKCAQYAPLLEHMAGWKKAIIATMDEIKRSTGDNGIPK